MDVRAFFLYIYSKTLLMEVNYNILVPVVFAVLVLILFLIRRNKRDAKKFEKEVNQTDTITDKHDKDRI